MQKYIKVEDIPKVSSPCYDYGVREYTAEEIAKEYLSGRTLLFARKNGKSRRDLTELLEKISRNEVRLTK